ncbi:hypothetical protein, partial [Streptococcus agalactiae]|uniref:hypothetical protein n=1 Tax=Streptococcus agalactiae TaxID=1311 RepID=UPI0005AA0361
NLTFLFKLYHRNRKGVAFVKKYIAIEIENTKEFEELYDDYLKKASELREVVQKLEQFQFTGILNNN